MPNILDHVITQCGNSPQDTFDLLYVCFNWFEAVAWFCLAGFIWVRFLKLRRSKVEIIYGFYVFVFGLTDVLELYQLTVGLFLTKALVLLSILVCRHFVVREYHDKGYKI